MARFSNAALRHRTRQIAMDGSQKLPQRLLATAQARLAAGQAISALALAIASWMRWQEGHTEAGEAVVVEDPLAAETARRLSGTSDDGDKVAALLDLEAVFPRALAGDPAFRQAITQAFLDLRRLGAVRAASFPAKQAA
jgi:fructuronate reductase